MTEKLREAVFDSAIHDGIPVEAIDYGELLNRMARTGWDQPFRARFHIVLIVWEGPASILVDSALIDLADRQSILIQPGQVVRLCPEARPTKAVALLVSERLATDSLWTDHAVVTVEADRRHMDIVEALVDLLSRSQRRYAGDGRSFDLVVHLVHALLSAIRFGPPGPHTTALPPAYVAFRDAVERGFTHSRDARFFMADLGYSERTIDRACEQARGRSAKGVLDDRIMLEARRLLAHTELTLAEVATSLGFAAASNFNKFFFRGEGELPSAYRRAWRLHSTLS